LLQQAAKLSAKYPDPIFAKLDSPSDTPLNQAQPGRRCPHRRQERWHHRRRYLIATNR